ncbi:HNH endonuclease signature motif containing protein [Litchfieldella anticariensis]|uniref:HNH endonuclease signature motif containing protein n=1 Tax=Litchfieldella anticariensis TaxID=258591 RepID=UPI00047FF47E|nr:HNH endonuclease signature motif containing protein [Halomonas anticariensis]
MKISKFFEEVLGANLTNMRWSWGAVNNIRDQVFLRVWSDQFKDIDGKQYIAVLKLGDNNHSSGSSERRHHVDKLRKGTEGYGVVCTRKYPDDGKRSKIKTFDNELLIKLGEVIESDGQVFAQVIDRIPVETLKDRRTGYGTLVNDIKEIFRRRVPKTTREALADARVGQGAFRSSVLIHWGGKCCVTGSTAEKAIRASHIKPWRDSTDEERLDPQNGLLPWTRYSMPAGLPSPRLERCSSPIA